MTDKNPRNLPGGIFDRKTDDFKDKDLGAPPLTPKNLAKGTSSFGTFFQNQFFTFAA